jgi:hypothetical protein
MVEDIYTRDRTGLLFIDPYNDFLSQRPDFPAQNPDDGRTRRPAAARGHGA